MRLVLDIRKTIEQNAGYYFDRAKKFKAKAKGARDAVVRFQAKLAKEPVVQEKVTVVTEILPKKWYEKFRWFLSSEGYLCVGGRDADSNEAIVKKHTEPHDILCHTEAPGSPFFVVKTEGTHPKENTINEVLQATASYSRAWKAGVAAAEAFWVNPDQVSKEAQSGEFIAKGSFMVRGKRTIQMVPLVLNIGVLPDNRIMGGPEAAVAKHCQKRMRVVQGDIAASDAAKKVIKYLGHGTPDEIIRLLPSGGVKVIGL